MKISVEQVLRELFNLLPKGPDPFAREVDPQDDSVFIHDAFRVVLNFRNGDATILMLNNHATFMSRHFQISPENIHFVSQHDSCWADAVVSEARKIFGGDPFGIDILKERVGYRISDGKPQFVCFY